MPIGRIEPIKPVTAQLSQGGTNDHNKLKNRDLTDQHTIESVTDLRNELDTLAEEIKAETDRAVSSEKLIEKSNKATITEIKSNINNEVIRAQNAEAELNKTIITNKVELSNADRQLNTRISTEVTRLEKEIKESGGGEVKKELDEEVKKREQLSNEVKAVELKVLQTTQNVTELTTNVNNLTTNVTNINVAVNSLENTTAELSSDVADLENTTTELSNNIVIIENTVEKKQDKLTAGDGVSIINNKITFDIPDGTIFDGGEII